MKNGDRNTAKQHDGSPAPGAGRPEAGACAASAGQAAPGCGRNRRGAPSIPSTPSERGRSRRKPFVLRAAGTADATESGTTATAGSRLARLLQKLGPYLLIEILLPGGTLLVLLLYASRNGRPLREDTPLLATLFALAAAAAQAISQRVPLAMLGRSRTGAVERDGLEPLGWSPA